MISMHITYCYHCEGPRTLYYNDWHAFLFQSLSLSMIKMHPKFIRVTPPMIFGISKKTEYTYVKVVFMKKLQLKFHQNRTRHKEVITFLVMTWKPQNFRKYLLIDSDSGSSQWKESNGVCFIKIGRLVFEIFKGSESPPPPPPVNVVQKAHQ